MVQRQILSWSQFTRIATPLPGQMQARNGSPIVAAVRIAIRFNPLLTGQIAEGQLYRFDCPAMSVVLLNASVVPSRLPPSRRDYYLRHEQGHMDLMTLLGRELEVKLTRLRKPYGMLLQEARTIVSNTIRSAHDVAINSPTADCRYDIETNHGMNQAAQRRWLQHIDSELRRMGDANYEFRSPN